MLYSDCNSNEKVIDTTCMKMQRKEKDIVDKQEEKGLLEEEEKSNHNYNHRSYRVRMKK